MAGERGLVLDLGETLVDVMVADDNARRTGQRLSAATHTRHITSTYLGEVPRLRRGAAGEGSEPNRREGRYLAWRQQLLEADVGLREELHVPTQNVTFRHGTARFRPNAQAGVAPPRNGRWTRMTQPVQELDDNNSEDSFQGDEASQGSVPMPQYNETVHYVADGWQESYPVDVAACLVERITGRRVASDAALYDEALLLSPYEVRRVPTELPTDRGTVIRDAVVRMRQAWCARCRCPLHPHFQGEPNREDQPLCYYCSTDSRRTALGFPAVSITAASESMQASQRWRRNCWQCGRGLRPESRQPGRCGSCLSLRSTTLERYLEGLDTETIDAGSGSEDVTSFVAL